jgi:hypothetical protein
MSKTAKDVLTEQEVGPMPGHQISDLEADAMLSDLEAAGFVIVPKEEGIPTATLRVEQVMLNPPKPVGCGVFVQGRLIAVVTLDELKRAAAAATQAQAGG